MLKGMSATASENVLVAVANGPYVPWARALFSGARARGKWAGDFALVTDTTTSEVRDLLDRGIHVLRLPRESAPLFLKLGLFHEFFARWQRLAYFDCDVVIVRELAALLELQGSAYADAESYPALWHFENTVHHLYERAARLLPQHLPGFNSGVLWWECQAFCGEATYRMANTYRKAFAPINRHGQRADGSDQGIFNILLAGRWSPFPNKEVHYWQEPPGDATIAIHFCHWMAPWLNDDPCPVVGGSCREVCQADLHSFSHRFPIGGPDGQILDLSHRFARFVP
jgi:hypothetical protein